MGQPMLFWTRSLLCIGAIVVLAEGFDLGDVVPQTQSLAGGMARRATGQIQRYCHDAPARCLAVAQEAMRASREPESVLSTSDLAASGGAAQPAGPKLARRRGTHPPATGSD